MSARDFCHRLLACRSLIDTRAEIPGLYRQGKADPSQDPCGPYVGQPLVEVGCSDGDGDGDGDEMRAP